MLTIAKMIFTLLMKLAEEWVDTRPPYYAYHVRGRSREAISIQLAAGYRLSMNSISFLRNFRDTKNAFPAIKHVPLLDAIDGIPDHASYIHDPLADAIQRNLFTIETDDGIHVYRAVCWQLYWQHLFLTWRMARDAAMDPTAKRGLRSPT
jgi:hypothetical protein